MRTWKVTYRHLEDMAARRAFFIRCAYVPAASRQEAIGKVQAKFPPPRYGRYTASPTDQPPDRFFS